MNYVHRVINNFSWIGASKDASWAEHDSYFTMVLCIGWSEYLSRATVECTVALLKVVVAQYLWCQKLQIFSQFFWYRVLHVNDTSPGTCRIMEHVKPFPYSRPFISAGPSSCVQTWCKVEQRTASSVHTTCQHKLHFHVRLYLCRPIQKKVLWSLKPHVHLLLWHQRARSHMESKRKLARELQNSKGKRKSAKKDGQWKDSLGLGLYRIQVEKVLTTCYFRLSTWSILIYHLLYCSLSSQRV